MLVTESVVVITLLCSTVKRQQAINSPSDGIHVVGEPLLIQRPSGRTLEAAMVNDIEKMHGVVSVSARRDGDTVNVSVVMDNLEFGPFSAVAQKELEISDKFPGLRFNFDIFPTAAVA